MLPFPAPSVNVFWSNETCKFVPDEALLVGTLILPLWSPKAGSGMLPPPEGQGTAVV